MQFRDADAEFDIPAFEHTVRLWTVTLEISVLMAQFPSKEVRNYPMNIGPWGWVGQYWRFVDGGRPFHDSDEGRAILQGNFGGNDRHCLCHICRNG